MAGRKRKADTAEAAGPEPGSMSFEDAIAEVESIIERMDEGAIGLAESLAAYRRGDALVKRCRTLLEEAEQEVETITGAALEDGDDHEAGADDAE